MNVAMFVMIAAMLLPKPYILGVTMPSGLATTLNNFMTAGQVIGGGAAGIILVIAGIQLMFGGRNSVEMGKTRLIFLCVGMVLVAGCSVIKAFIDGLMAF